MESKRQNLWGQRSPSWTHSRHSIKKTTAENLNDDQHEVTCELRRHSAEPSAGKAADQQTTLWWRKELHSLFFTSNTSPSLSIVLADGFSLELTSSREAVLHRWRQNITACVYPPEPTVVVQLLFNSISLLLSQLSFGPITVIRVFLGLFCFTTGPSVVCEAPQTVLSHVKCVIHIKFDLVWQRSSQHWCSSFGSTASYVLYCILTD